MSIFFHKSREFRGFKSFSRKVSYSTVNRGGTDYVIVCTYFSSTGLIWGTHGCIFQNRDNTRNPWTASLQANRSLRASGTKCTY